MSNKKEEKLMRCSRCGAEMKIKNIQTGTDRRGNPIYRKYAVCYHCKTKRNLEKDLPAASSKRRRRKKRKRLIFPLILLLILLLTIIAGFFFYKKYKADQNAKEENSIVTNARKNLIDPKDFNDIKIGMSQDEIIDLIGTDGSLLTKTSIDSSVWERYQWITKEGQGTVLLTFLDGKLISLSQTGIKDDDLSEISDKELALAKAGMSREELSDTFGSSGIRISETINEGVTTSVYYWKHDKTGILYSAVFVDGKLQHIRSSQNSSTGNANTVTTNESH